MASDPSPVRPRVPWLFGLSGSGKTTLGLRLVFALRKQGRAAVLLDGDAMRAGLSCDLGFEPEGRRENIRRTAEVARLLLDQNIVPVCACITPAREHRALAREIIGHGQFVAMYLRSSLAICRRRDAKGLYGLAERGEIREFTGVGAAFEDPIAEQSHTIDTEHLPVESSFAQVWEHFSRDANEGLTTNGHVIARADA